MKQENAKEIIVQARLTLIVNKNLELFDAIKNAIVIPDTHQGFVENIKKILIEVPFKKCEDDIND